MSDLRWWTILAALLLASCSDRKVETKDTGPEWRRDFGHFDWPWVDKRVDVKRDAPRDLAKGDRPKDILPPKDVPMMSDYPPKPDIIIKDGAKITSPVDILVVVDNSNTMQSRQTALAAQFGTLIDALKLGGTLPDLHIGVISTDLGAGSYSFTSCEKTGGDGGKLKNTPMSTACTAPTNPWISHVGGVTNVPSGSTDPAQRVKDAFACIAQLGVGGCGFEQPLEAARKALDPAIGVNPGFLRSNALLAILFLTDEDDCSAKNTTLFDPSSTVYGQLASYRCTQYGLVCDQPLSTIGTKTNCAPGLSLLYPAADYISFFKGLKSSSTGKVFLAAIAGPTSPFVVNPSGANLELKASCTSTTNGSAVPGVRLKAVVDGMGSTGIFNLGVSANKLVDVSICSADYSPVMTLLGLQLAGAI
jgi:hypothetical protein